jgi:hypothetical protein
MLTSTILVSTNQQSRDEMDPGKRWPRDRRCGIPVEFPLTDSQGRGVAHDRRSGNERRKAIASLEELWALHTRLSSQDSEH